MLITRNRIASATVVASALASALTPAAAPAAVHAKPILRGSPQMILVDAHHATLRFAAQRIGRTAAGAVDAKISSAGSRLYDTKPIGTHGGDIVYATKVASRYALKNHEVLNVRFRLGGSASVDRKVKIYKASELQPGPSSASSAGAPASAYACNDGPDVPCSFSTPSGNVRCIWTPSPNNVACQLTSSGRAYRLSPTGAAQRVTLALTARGDTLPTNQQVVFPDSLSCHDTNTSMTCNQDFGFGAFTLAPKGSTSS
jgi:hypothetical protein